MADDYEQVFGEIIRVNSINTYIIKVPSKAPFEIGIGEFIGVDSGEGLMVCVIEGIQRIIPEEIINLVSVEHESKYLPYNTDFKNNYYTAFALGTINHNTVNYHVRTAPQLRSPVKRINRELVRKFHMKDNKPGIPYFKRYQNMLEDNVQIRMLDELISVLPESSKTLLAVKKHLENSGGSV